MAMTAAALIPMIALVGGAVDASRLYMTKTRLQAACDSAVLAGRRAMTTATYTQTAADRADAMFYFNYQDDDYQATGTDFVASADASGKLDGRATTTIPMTLMKMFGHENKVMSVQCSADIQVPNIDVVFVLDVTGSMDETIDGVRRIDALKTAAKNFYSTLKNQLDTQGANAGQVRYGFVPYSQTVNVKDLFKSSPDASKGELPLSHLASNMVVESRVAHFSGESSNWERDSGKDETYTQTYDKNTSSRSTIRFTGPYNNMDSNGTNISNADCDWYADNLSFNIGGINHNAYMYPNTSWPGDQGRGYSTLYLVKGASEAYTLPNSIPSDATEAYVITFSRVSGEWDDDNGSKTNKYRVCKRRVKMEYYKKDSNKFDHWTYKPVTYDVSAYLSGSSIAYAYDFKSDYSAPGPGPYTPVELVSTPHASDLKISYASWTGCIEERDTLARDSFTPIPADAYDMNVLIGGTSAATRWRPVLERLTYDRTRLSTNETPYNLSSASVTCPSARIRNLNVISQSDFNSYMDSLSPGGNTYLDIGMVWGLRLISPQGMFGDRNLVGPNGGQISRHVIFLTDGELVPNDTTISAWGIERLSRRVVGTTGKSSSSLHATRFQALCDLQRGRVSIWAIAFGTSVTSNLSKCADPDRAFQANNATELNAAFQNIATDIADLRLVQ